MPFLILTVTPLVGVWIEIAVFASIAACNTVTPLVGVWIEIGIQYAIQQNLPSLPLWECGLKSVSQWYGWYARCHSPCGSVD